MQILGNMGTNKIEVCECGHNRCEHIPICCFDGECKCKKYKRRKTITENIGKEKSK